MLPPTDNFLRMALPALVLGVLLAVCCYFGNLGRVGLGCVRVFIYKLYKVEAVVQNDAPPLVPPGPPPAPKPMLGSIEGMQSRDTAVPYFGRINNGIQVITNHLFSCVLFCSLVKIVTDGHGTEY